MTDRVNALTVVLTDDIRTDDIHLVTDAILMLRGVLTVKTHVSDVTDHVAYARARNDLQQRLFAALREDH